MSNMAGAEAPQTTDTDTATVVLSGARPLVRAGIRVALGDDLDVVAEVVTSRLVVTVSEQQPSVVIVVVGEGEGDPFREVAAATAVTDDLRVLAITEEASVMELREAIVAGVRSILLADAPLEAVRDAALRTAAGERVLAPDIAIQLAGSWAGQEAAPQATLTIRELDVLRQLAEGRTNKEIGEELGLSPRTVKTHVQNLLVKLDTPDRTGAVAQGFRRGLIT